VTSALEIGDVSRFRSIKQAISYCGLCGYEKSSGDNVLRTPLSKQRNKHIPAAQAFDRERAVSASGTASVADSGE
jgi:transposase